MKAKQFDCPSCGASMKVKKGESMITCPYCESTVVVPTDHSHSHQTTVGGISISTDSGTTMVRGSSIPSVNLGTSAATKSCGRMAVLISAMMIIGIAGAVFFFISAQRGKVSEALGISGGPPVLMEFGGEGMGAGYFTDAECLSLDSDGNIYVGEWETGRIQVFNSSGDYIRQWDFGKESDEYLSSMAAARDGTLYLVFSSEIHIYDGMTGDYLGDLQHPDGWGFDDVFVCDDGSILASWYCGRDDIVRFTSDGEVDLLITEAITSQTGDYESTILVCADGMGNIFGFGTSHESVFKFTEDGRFVTRFGSEGDRPGQFTFPSCYTVDSHGRLWFSDFGDLIVFDNDGLYLETFDPGCLIYDMEITSDYRLIGITGDETIIELDISKMVEDL